MKFLTLIFAILIVNTILCQENKIYPCKTPSNIDVQISGYRHMDTIPRNVLVTSGKIDAVAGKFIILSYTISIISNAKNCCEGSGCTINISGGKFTDEIISWFKRINSGAEFIVECIVAKDLKGNIVGLRPAFYAIR